MTSQDDIAYRKSVRNMSLVLAAIVITIFSALLIPPYLFPAHNNFQRAVSFDSPFGFALHLQVNTTSTAPGGHVLLTGWLNNSSGSIVNVTASNSWPLGLGGLWTKPCISGWPIGVGVMKGHYTSDNYTFGSLIPIVRPTYFCPVQSGTPSYFLIEPHSSRVLVDVGGSPQYWVIETAFAFGPSIQAGGQSQLPVGTYTAILADEWGEVLTTNFIVG